MSTFSVKTKNDALWRPLYPFESRYVEIDGFQYHYVDEGPTEPDGVERPTLLMSHGNPTWSFVFRDVIKAFRGKYRTIAVDHIGCGLSEKPSIRKYPYSHDGGGAVAMGTATRIPERFSKIVLMNTAAYLNDRVPKRIRLCHIPILKRIMLQGLNVFPRAATKMATEKGLSEEVKAGLLAPYDTWANRIAVCEFVQDIPTTQRHRSYETLKTIQEKLPTLADKEIALIWGMEDWCFPPEIFMKKFQEYYPNAFVRELKGIGHYLMEDAPEETIAAIREFLEK